MQQVSFELPGDSTDQADSWLQVQVIDEVFDFGLLVTGAGDYEFDLAGRGEKGEGLEEGVDSFAVGESAEEQEVLVGVDSGVEIRWAIGGGIEGR